MILGADRWGVGALSRHGTLCLAVMTDVHPDHKSNDFRTDPTFWSMSGVWAAMGSEREMDNYWQIAYFGTEVLRGVYSVQFPMWLAILVSVFVPLWYLAAYIRRSKISPDDHPLCFNCGYDLYGSQGASSGVTIYEFTEQTGNLVKGENRWKVQEGPEDHGGDELPEGTNSFLGVIADDGTIYLVADGDTAIRRLRMTSSDTIDFVEFAGGEHQVVVSVKLFRGVQ